MSTPPKRPTSPGERRGTEPVARGAGAGILLLAAILVCSALGAGIGVLVGAVAPFTVLGVFAGFAAGIAAVITRFRDL